MAKKKKEVKREISFKFASILAIVSIIGFIEIMIFSFLGFSIDTYMDFLWLSIMGVGFILASQPKKLPEKKSDNESVADITALVIGAIAIIAGLLSLPFIGIDHPVFSATKGVISVICIIFIVLETWVMKNKI